MSENPEKSPEKQVEDNEIVQKPKEEPITEPETEPLQPTEQSAENVEKAPDKETNDVQSESTEVVAEPPIQIKMEVELPEDIFAPDDANYNETENQTENDVNIGAVAVEPIEVPDKLTATRKDAPVEFFDEFLNQDFLDGLDVVDAWDADDTAVKIEPIEAEPEETETEIETPRDEDVGKKNRSKSREKRREKSPPREQHRSRRPEKSRESRESKDTIGNQSRRDPLKVKRDIQRDKAKCTRDKLKVVETGLVPPGMEMEMADNAEETRLRREYEKCEREIHEHRSRIDHTTTASGKRRYSRSISPRNRTRFKATPTPSPPRHYKHSTSRLSDNSRRSRHRSLSSSPPPPRYRRPSPYSRPIVDKRPRRPHARSRSRSRSPDYRRKIDRINKDHRSSPPRKKQKSFLDELEDKLNEKPEYNKLREIQAKINGGPTPIPIRNPMHGPGAMVPTPVLPVPVPVATPMAPMVVNPYMSAPVYDQQFFIGHQDFVAPFGPQNPMTANYPLNPMNNPSIAPNPYYNPAPHHQPSIVNQQSVDDMEKLFNDPNITLSSFLQIRRRPEDLSKKVPTSKKDKVLNHCQDALKIITEFTRPTGHFYCKSSKLGPKGLATSKRSSPLKRLDTVQFHYTTKSQRDAELLESPINRLMKNLGLWQAPPPVVIKETTPQPSLAAERSTNQQQSSSAAVNNNQPFKRKTKWSPAKVLMKMTQTDAPNCDRCEKRDRKRYADVGVQCDVLQTASVASQVIEEDFLSTARSALKNILKNRSLASLTPAQILAQLEGQKEQPAKKTGPPVAAVMAADMDIRPKEIIMQRRAPEHFRQAAAVAGGGEEYRGEDNNSRYQQQQNWNNSGAYYGGVGPPANNFPSSPRKFGGPNFAPQAQQSNPGPNPNMPRNPPNSSSSTFAAYSNPDMGFYNNQMNQFPRPEFEPPRNFQGRRF